MKNSFGDTLYYLMTIIFNTSIVFLPTISWYIYKSFLNKSKSPLPHRVSQAWIVFYSDSGSWVTIIESASWLWILFLHPAIWEVISTSAGSGKTNVSFLGRCEYKRTTMSASGTEATQWRVTWPQQIYNKQVKTLEKSLAQKGNWKHTCKDLNSKCFDLREVAGSREWSKL